MTEQTQHSQPLYTPEALKRVVTRYSVSQDDAAVIEVDYSNGRDVAYLTINPDLAPIEAVSGYEVRAAVMAALEGFRRYRRNVTRRFGIRPEQEALFMHAYEKALFELQQLAHLTPCVLPPALPDTTVELSPVHAEDPLLPSFYMRALLASEGVHTYQAVNDMSDEELGLIFAPEQVKQIRAEVEAYLNPLPQLIGSELLPDGTPNEVPELTPSVPEAVSPEHVQAFYDKPAAPAAPQPSYSDDWNGSQQERQAQASAPDPFSDPAYSAQPGQAGKSADYTPENTGGFDPRDTGQ